MNNILDLEKELVYWSDVLYLAEVEFGKADAALAPLEAIKKIKQAFIESQQIAKSEKGKERLTLISDEWIAFNDELSAKQTARVIAKSNRDAARVKFESVRSRFSLRKLELTMIGGDYDKTKARG